MDGTIWSSLFSRDGMNCTPHFRMRTSGQSRYVIKFYIRRWSPACLGPPPTAGRISPPIEHCAVSLIQELVNLFMWFHKGIIWHRVHWSRSGSRCDRTLSWQHLPVGTGIRPWFLRNGDTRSRTDRWVSLCFHRCVQRICILHLRARFKRWHRRVTALRRNWPVDELDGHDRQRVPHFQQVFLISS